MARGAGQSFEEVTMEKRKASLINVAITLAIFWLLSAGYSYGKNMATSEIENCDLQNSG